MAIGPFGHTLGLYDDEPDPVCECGAIEGTDADFCAAGRCVECCDEQGDCHVICSRCKLRVSVEDVCSCCGRCFRHDCKREEDAERDLVALEAKGDEMRDERWLEERRTAAT